MAFLSGTDKHAALARVRRVRQKEEHDVKGCTVRREPLSVAKFPDDQGNAANVAPLVRWFTSSRWFYKRGREKPKGRFRCDLRRGLLRLLQQKRQIGGGETA